jgi:hypothetical protein
MLKSPKGFSIVTLLIIVALLIAAFNVYAYFDPSFQLSQFSVVHFLRDHNDKQRIADIAKIKDAVEKYYDDHGEYPATDGWCSRIYSVMYPEVKDEISPYFKNVDIPSDPSFGGTNKEYFYRREDKNTAVLMAALENLPSVSSTYNYSGCYDWPGDNIYNYRVTLNR